MGGQACLPLSTAHGFSAQCSGRKGAQVGDVLDGNLNLFHNYFAKFFPFLFPLIFSCEVNVIFSNVPHFNLCCIQSGLPLAGIA